MLGGVLYRGLDQHPGCALGQGASGKIGRQLEVKMVGAIAVSLALNRGDFIYRNVHAGGFHGDLATIYRLAKEIVGAYGPGYVVTGSVTTLGLVVLSGKIKSNFELGQDVSLDVQGDFRSVRRGRIGFTHQRTKVVGAKIYLVGQAKFRRRNSELVGLRGFLEYLVAA